jgi:2-oxoisovalerate dehydrogenase E1 component
VLAPLGPYHADAVAREAARPADAAAREHAFALPSVPGFQPGGDGPRLPEHQPARHLAVQINWALHDLMAKYPEMLVFGEDVARKGGVYHVTAGLTNRFGLARVYNTLLDETTILGSAIGAGHLGLLPVPEIQYLAYVHNAIDQLRGEACSSQFFSCDQFRTPMVVRIASLAYQKGFGGHFHNDNSFAALRDIPGIIIGCPSRGDDAARMLRTCLALARVDGRVVCFLEPIALYMTKDLHEPGDGLWQFKYPPPNEAISLGDGHVYDADARDLTLITFGNGVPMSLRVARRLAAEGVAARVVDLRWINPLNREFIVEQSRATGRVLVVDEGRCTGGLSEAILAILAEEEIAPARRITGLDTYVPLGPAANCVLPTDDQILEAARRVMEAVAT